MISSPSCRIRVLCDVVHDLEGDPIPSFLFLTARDTHVNDLKVMLSKYIVDKFHTTPGLFVTAIHDCFTPHLTFLLDNSVRLSMRVDFIVPHV
jgi:hypothetical protein